MEQNNNFEKVTHTKPAIKLLRQQAILMRDLLFLKQQNQNRSFALKTALLIFVLLAFTLTVTIISARHFNQLRAPIDHCAAVLYDAVNFTSACGLCEKNWKINQGICSYIQ